MEYLIGLALALSAIGLAAGLGWDRDRSFGPTVMIVIAAYYVLFALMGGSTRTVVIEILVANVFLLIAVAGFKTNPLLVAAAMVGHGLFDFVHNLFIENSGMPIWWPGFCGAFDVVFGGWLVVLLVRRTNRSLTASE